MRFLLVMAAVGCGGEPLLDITLARQGGLIGTLELIEPDCPQDGRAHLPMAFCEQHPLAIGDLDGDPTTTEVAFPGFTSPEGVVDPVYTSALGDFAPTPLRDGAGVPLSWSQLSGVPERPGYAYQSFAGALDIDGDGRLDTFMPYPVDAGTPDQRSAYFTLGGAGGIPVRCEAPVSSQVEPGATGCPSGPVAAYVTDINQDGRLDFIAEGQAITVTLASGAERQFPFVVMLNLGAGRFVNYPWLVGVDPGFVSLQSPRQFTVERRGGETWLFHGADGLNHNQVLRLDRWGADGQPVFEDDNPFADGFHFPDEDEPAAYLSNVGTPMGNAVLGDFLLFSGSYPFFGVARWEDGAWRDATREESLTVAEVPELEPLLGESSSQGIPWCLLPLDLDGDGGEELIIAHGDDVDSVRPRQEGDTWFKGRAHGFRVLTRRGKGLSGAAVQWLDEGGGPRAHGQLGSFRDVFPWVTATPQGAPRVGFGATGGALHSPELVPDVEAYAGLLGEDVFRLKPVLFEGEGGHHTVVRLHGTSSPPQGQGAVVRFADRDEDCLDAMLAGQDCRGSHEIVVGRDGGGHVIQAPRAILGTRGNRSGEVDLVIRWPSGHLQQARCAAASFCDVAEPETLTWLEGSPTGQVLRYTPTDPRGGEPCDVAEPVVQRVGGAEASIAVEPVGCAWEIRLDLPAESLSSWLATRGAYGEQPLPTTTLSVAVDGVELRQRPMAVWPTADQGP